jgi:hypothetical protein
MKRTLIPVRVFETGDRVMTREGMGTVIHDEMEGYESHMAALSCSLESPCVERAVEDAQMRKGIFVSLDKPTPNHPNVEEDFICGRDEIQITADEPKGFLYNPEWGRK